MLNVILKSIVMIAVLGLSLGRATAAPAPSALEEALAVVRALHAELTAENQRLRQELIAARAEVPRIEAQVGQAVHLNAADVLGELPPEPHLHELAWDFGDAGAAYNRTGGFNAAHVYSRPGVYPVQLNGQVVRTIGVREASRPQRLVRDAVELAQVVGRGEIARLPPGTMSLSSTLRIAPGGGIVGDGTGSTLLWAGDRKGLMINATGGLANITGVTFDSVWNDTTSKDAVDAIAIGGRDVSIVDCTFLNINTAINGNGKPKRVLVQGCRAPLATGLRAYLCWVEGEQWVIQGNYAANSTREHIIRCSTSNPKDPPTKYVLLSGNDFANTDRRPLGDEGDYAKSTINFQVVEYGWAQDNVLRGPAEAGPLGEGDGLMGGLGVPLRVRYIVFRENQHFDALRLKHGLEHVLVADNRIEHAAGSGGGAEASLFVEPYNGRYERGVTDVTIRGNQLRSPYSNARQIWIQGRIFGRLDVSQNVVVAGEETLKWSSHPLVIEGGWWQEYRFVGNTFPPAPGIWPDKQAVVRLGEQNDKSAYLQPAAFAQLPGVEDNRFVDVELPPLPRLDSHANDAQHVPEGEVTP